MASSVKTLEAEFQQQLIDMAHLFGWIVAHFRPALTKRGWRTPVSADGKGFPDLVLVRDRTIYVEVKREGEKLSEDQTLWRDWLLNAGVEWYCWKPSDFDTAASILRRKSERMKDDG